MIETGYVMPHWPKPWGRDAGAVEQLVIEQEFKAAGVSRPQYAITGWVILTLIQHATEDQVARWVMPALRQDVIWCQLFSEPDAGSDAAGVKTRGTRVDGGLARQRPEGVDERRPRTPASAWPPSAPTPTRRSTRASPPWSSTCTPRAWRSARSSMVTGHSEFNEVFFNDVFVPDDDVVGPVNGGWTVARATLGQRERVHRRRPGRRCRCRPTWCIAPFDAHPERLAGGAGRVGRFIARTEAMAVLNMRSAHRAVIGGGPGPEGNVTKLVLVGDRARGGGHPGRARRAGHGLRGRRRGHGRP